VINSRQRLALALHSLGDEIQPSSSRDQPAAGDANRRRREEIIRLNRLELIRQAREEGIAVDLDELQNVERQYDEAAATAARSRADSSRGFDDIVGSDGMLRNVDMTEQTSAQTSGAYLEATTLRYRGAGSRGLDAGSRGLDAGSLYANPFGDEAQILFDHDDVSQDHNELRESRESSRTLSPAPLIDTSDTQSEYFSEEELEAQIEEAIRRSLENISEAPVEEATADPPVSIPIDEGSYYYAPPPNVHQPPVSANALYTSAIEAMLQDQAQQQDNEDESHTPAGTMTPTEDGFSMAGSAADDVGNMSDLHSIAGSIAGDMDDQMSEGGYTTDYSMVGASTPGSWTDVESEAGDEAHNGHHIAHDPPIANI
jgi:hypothetical protein